VAEPALTIGLVILAFTFIPWLSQGQSAKGSIADRIRSGAAVLQKDMKGEVNKVVDVDKLSDKAQETLKELGEKAKALDLEKLGTQAVHFLQQDFACIVNEADAAEVYKKLGTRSGSIKFAPALLERSHTRAGEAALDSEEQFSALILGGDSKHFYATSPG
jgi:hypothetical protein